MEDVTQETDVKIIDKNGEEFTDTDMGYLNVSKVYVTANYGKFSRMSESVQSIPVLRQQDIRWRVL